MRLPPSRWAELVALHRSSGLTTLQFATQHGVHPKSLARWRQRVGSHGPGRGFVEVALVPAREPAPRAAPTREFRVELTTQPVSIAVPAGSDLVWLRAIVQALS